MLAMVGEPPDVIIINLVLLSCFKFLPLVLIGGSLHLWFVPIIKPFKLISTAQFLHILGNMLLLFRMLVCEANMPKCAEGSIATQFFILTFGTQLNKTLIIGLIKVQNKVLHICVFNTDTYRHLFLFSFLLFKILASTGWCRCLFDSRCWHLLSIFLVVYMASLSSFFFF